MSNNQIVIENNGVTTFSTDNKMPHILAELVINTTVDFPAPPYTTQPYTAYYTYTKYELVTRREFQRVCKDVYQCRTENVCGFKWDCPIGAPTGSCGYRYMCSPETVCGFVNVCDYEWVDIRGYEWVEHTDPIPATAYIVHQAIFSKEYVVATLLKKPLEPFLLGLCEITSLDASRALSSAIFVNGVPQGTIPLQGSTLLEIYSHADKAAPSIIRTLTLLYEPSSGAVKLRIEQATDNFTILPTVVYGGALVTYFNGFTASYQITGKAAIGGFN
jgi:hypothetical protein